MRKISVFIIVCSFACSCHKDTTSTKNDVSLCFDTEFIPTTITGLYSTFFINDKDGFAGTYNGAIYKTTDSAKNWTSLTSTTTLPIRSLFFVNAQTGFAVGGLNSCSGTGCIIPGAFILKTIDGGQTWVKIYTPSSKIEINSIFFLNETLGFCAGGNIIFKTTDGGQIWTEYVVNNLGSTMMEIKFINAQKGYVVCLFDKILITENGGASWQLTSPNRNIGYYSISESNGATYVSGQGKIIKSTNGGTSWNELSNSPSDIFALHFLNSQKGFAFGRGNYSGGDFGYSMGSLYCTNDGGASWNGTASIKESYMIRSVSFPSDKIGYAISGNKIIRLKIK